MSKTVRTLAFCLAALILLAGSYAVVLALFPSEEGEGGDVSSSTGGTSSSETVSTPVTYMYEYEETDLVSAEINSQNAGTYHVSQDGMSYVIDELDGITVYDSMMETLIERLAAYPYAYIASESPTEEELEEYGLSDPIAGAVINFTDGTETLSVGGTDEDGAFYVLREADGKVYVVSQGMTTYFVKGHVAFINTTLFYCTEDRRTGIDNLVFTDSEEDMPVTIGKVDPDSKTALAVSSTYCIKKPLEMSVNIELLDEGLTQLCKFSAESAVALVDNGDDLSAYGLDSPRYTLEFTYQKPLDDDAEEGAENTNPVTKYKFIISEPDEDGNMYIKEEDSRIVMSFEEGVYSFFDWNINNMAGSTFLTPLIKYVDKVIVTCEGKEYEFRLTPGDGSIVAAAYMDGERERQLDVDNFKNFYQVIIGTGRIGTGYAEEDAATRISVRFVYQDEINKDDDVVAFREYSLRQYAAEVNGEGYFTVAKTRVDKLENDLIKVINNEPVNAFMN